MWDLHAFAVLQTSRWHIPMGRARPYDELLEGLRTGESGCRYERRIQLPRTVPMAEEGKKQAEACARDLHMAFGGVLYWGGEVGWEGFRKVLELVYEGDWE